MQSRSARSDAVQSFWFDRFQILDRGGETLHCRDWLRPIGIDVARRGLDFSATGISRTIAELFGSVFLNACETSFPQAIRDTPCDAGDLMFWQFPCRTEMSAWQVHAARKLPGRTANEVHCYVALPWATWIDKQRVDPVQVEADRQVRQLATRLRGVRAMLHSVGLKLRVHTVCQHIYWTRLLPQWQCMGLTDLWLSHAPRDDADCAVAGIKVHAWPLYAVNIEDPERCHGLRAADDCAPRPRLASFIGAYMPHYLSDSRLRLSVLVDKPGFHIEVQQSGWHFEKVVYDHQICHRISASECDDRTAVERYNHVLSDSEFSLCPAGAGLNTLRFWESLAVGAIPVLMDSGLRLPDEGVFAGFDWNSAVVDLSALPVAAIPEALQVISPGDRERRRQLCREAYRWSRQYACF